MRRKRITEMFPSLIPIRCWQKNLFYQIKMRFDGVSYAKKKTELLKYEISSSKSSMINQNSGYDIQYQYNKVHNLKVLSNTMNRITIYPKEVFSFCYLANNYKKYGKYKDGLILINKEIKASKGGGICQLSNLLYLTFLKSPLTIIERHPHRIKSIPNQDVNSLDGIDSTISSGWYDLKVKNNTNNIYQIVINFDDDYIETKLLSNVKDEYDYKIINKNKMYFKENDKVFEYVEIYKQIFNGYELVDNYKLYNETIEIGYELEEGVIQ